MTVSARKPWFGVRPVRDQKNAGPDPFPRAAAYFAPRAHARRGFGTTHPAAGCRASLIRSGAVSTMRGGRLARFGPGETRIKRPEARTDLVELLRDVVLGYGVFDADVEGVV